MIDIAIVGGGATGVELAAELSRMVEFAAGYGEVDIRRRLRVTLIESASRILGAFPDAVSTSAAAQLRALGVDVRTGVRVVAADAHGFLLDGGERIPAALKVWAAGVRASTTLDKSGLELNRAGQVVVQRNLLARNDPSIFALGDCAAFMPEGADRPLPPTAQVANQQALHLIRHLPAWLQEGKPLPSFRFRDLGALVALSDYNAFGTLGRFGFFTGRFIKGQFARLSHALLYRRLSAGASRHSASRAAVGGRTDQRARAAEDSLDVTALGPRSKRLRLLNGVLHLCSTTVASERRGVSELRHQRPLPRCRYRCGSSRRR